MLELYKIKMKYVRNLMNIDHKSVASVSSQRNKNNRLFVGIIIMVEGQQYCIPMSSVSGKDKYKDMAENITFRKIIDASGNLIGVLNINNMIPVREEYLIPFDIDIKASDTEKQKEYKRLCQDELKWCNEHENEITRLAQELHRMVVSDIPFKKKKICADYKKLEAECNKAKKL